jgi:hypothetical protein
MTRQSVNGIQQIDAFLGGFGIGWNWQSAELCDWTVGEFSKPNGRGFGLAHKGI